RLAAAQRPAGRPAARRAWVIRRAIPSISVFRSGVLSMTSSPLPAGFASDAASARPLHVLEPSAFAAWLDAQPEATRAWLQAQQFKAAAGTHALLPGEDGVAGAVLGIGDPLDAYSYAHGPMALPEGDWTPAGELPAAQA